MAANKRGDQPLSGLNSLPTMQMGNFPLMLGQGPDGQPLSGLNSVPTMQMGNLKIGNSSKIKYSYISLQTKTSLTRSL
jgi:hypothetical protein